MKAAVVCFTPLEDGTLEIHFQNGEEIQPYSGGAVPRTLRPMLTSKLKKLAGLDVAEKRTTQHGAFEMMLEGRIIMGWDLLVEPTSLGEKLIARLNYKEE